MLRRPLHAVPYIVAAGVLSGGCGCSSSPNLSPNVPQAVAPDATNPRIDEAELAAETERRRLEEIQNRLRVARAFVLEQQYDQALSELDAAQFLAPDNPVIQAFREILEDAVAAQAFGLKRGHRDLDLAHLPLVRGPVTTPVLFYQDELPELTQLRLDGLAQNDGEAEEKANELAHKQLDKIISLNNDHLTLGQVINYLRDTTGANIAVNWPALELAGLDQDSLVSVSLKKVRAEQLLRYTLDYVSADAFDTDKAGYAIGEGVVKISTLRDLRTATETRVYDIRKLLVGVGIREERIDQIVEIIQSNVGDPDEWLDEESTLAELNGNLIIKTTPNNHKQLRELFNKFDSPIDQAKIEAALKALEADRLLDKIVSLNNNNFTLQQVVDFIREVTDTNLVMNWAALELVGIDQDAIVSLSLSNVTAEQLLQLMLEQVSADAFDDDKAGYIFQDGLVKVSTRRDLKIITEIRVYDVTDLVGKGRHRVGLSEQINVLIQETVGDPDEWLDEESMLTELDGKFIIKTTATNHTLIMRLLTQLREPIDRLAMKSALAKMKASRRARQPLDRALTLNKDNFTLDQAIWFLRDATGANIYVNWAALDLIDVDEDTLLSVSVKDMPAGQLLELLLKQASGEGVDRDDEIGFRVVDDIVKITLRQDLDRDRVTEVYDISDLLRKARHREERVEEIIQMIHTQIGHEDEWVDMESLAIDFQGRLVIKTSPDHRRAVMELLTKRR